MSPSEPSLHTRVASLDPAGTDYHRAFEVFLAFTDQKVVAAEYLSDVVSQLPNRRVFIDAGAGRGETTRWIAARFEHTIAVEPSTHMHGPLRRACPSVQLVGTTIDSANITDHADLVLCAHVLYYLPTAQWVATARRMLGWVAGGGELILVLQNPESDCMRMVNAFTGFRYDLSVVAYQIAGDAAFPDMQTVLDTIPATIHTEREADAVTIAEFMLNLAPMNSLDELPYRSDLHNHVRDEFTDPSGGFTFTCTQDFLRLRLATPLSRSGQHTVGPAQSGRR